MLRVEAFDAPADGWDAFVRAQPTWTHFHLHGWRDVMEHAFGHECLFSVARDEKGGLRGVLPLVRVRSALFGHYLVSMPFLNYGGPLGEEAAVRALAQHAAGRASAERATLLELRSRAPLPVELPASQRKITVLLDLPTGDSAPLWDALKSKVRSQVRRPVKEGIEVRFGPEQLGPFYTVFAHHMRDLGTPVLGRQVFRTIAETFPDSVWFGCAWLRGRPVAGGCGFRWGTEFEMTWAASLRAYHPIAPNMLLYWRFMERCVEQGVRTFNFGRCTPGGGTHRFKGQWGGRDVPLWWYHWSATDAVATPHPGDARFSWGPRLWKHLPLTVARIVGPPIARSLP